MAKRVQLWRFLGVGLTLMLLVACGTGSSGQSGGGSGQQQNVGTGKQPEPGTGGQAGTGQEPKAAPGQEMGEIRLGYQFGTSYLPVEVIVEKGLLAKRLNVKVTRQQLGGGGALTEAVLSGSTDVAFMGLGPFFVGWAKGIDWRIAAAMQDMPIGLNSAKPGASSLKDIGPEDKIAVPGINSIQHVMLAMEAERQLGDARALDQRLVAMAHPDGETALLAKSEVTFHYTAPPFLQREREQPGISKIVDSYETMGQSHTFNVMVVPAKFKQERPELYQALVEAMAESQEWIKANPEAAAELMIQLGDKTPKAELVKQITDPTVIWTSEPHGLMKFATFMHKAGFIGKAPKDWKEITWENLHTLSGD